MIKLALTGPQLAELYLMNAMGVSNDKLLEESQNIPYSQRIYSVDTEYGREKLLEYAIDLLGNIKKQNDYFINKLVFRNKREYIRNHYYKKEIVKYLDQYLKNALLEIDHTDKLNLHHVRIKLQEKVNDLIETILLKNPLIHNSPIISWWAEDLEEFMESSLKSNDVEQMINSIKSGFDFLLSDSKFVDCFVNAEIIKYEENDEWAILKNYENENWERIRDDKIKELKNSDSATLDFLLPRHFAIDDVLISFMADIISTMKDNATRNDFLKVMQSIDYISSLSHHGGPLFEYGDTTEKDSYHQSSVVDPNLIEIMHRKFGDSFITWALSNDVIKDENLKKDLKKWYEEMKSRKGLDIYHQDLADTGDDEYSKNLNINLSHDDYYKHFKFQSPKDFDQYVVYNSPFLLDFTPQQWLEEYRFKYPSLAIYIDQQGGDINEVENILNIGSIKDSLDKTNVNQYSYRRVREIEKFLKKHSDITDDVINNARKFVNDIKQEKLKLWKKEARNLDMNSFHIQADVLEKNIYKMTGN